MRLESFLFLTMFSWIVAICLNIWSPYEEVGRTWVNGLSIFLIILPFIVLIGTNLWKKKGV